ncbi:MAG: hypothetical protein A2W05_05605 [Candidatus Schekmanbacteria bacterium RBG_16_38_10]|uniref:Late embryogenesis abundant protein LEA-2 subgroup domain-containing protein n=1 Tax=Candidatus Schekmanbacteria bacterium RBG_16_38_10 TaxID=1817879 RepID=A0A1F7RPK4_9BACT|nr:MAG: hypothetical protein A2W05_05605 [Candidatus Schekmanbacteria bacterium RBG_16_38_10]
MKKSRLLISISLILMLLVCSSAFAGFKFNPKKPFAGKFKASLEYQGNSLIIVYILKMQGNNITGTVDTNFNGVDLPTLNVSGTVNENKKSADITVAGATQIGSPTDFVRVALIGNGKNGVRMRYLDAIGGNILTDFPVVKYKRLKK